MKLGVPWGLKGIRPEARDAAKEAARRAGMSLEDWLNSAISHTAAQMGVPPQGQQAVHYQPAGNAGVMAPMHHAELNNRINQVTGRGPEAYAPRHMRTAPLQHLPRAPSLQPPMSPPGPRVRWSPDLDRAVAEIAARQRALSGGAPRHPAAKQSQPRQAQPVHHYAEPAGHARPPVPAQDLSGLEDQLRHITAQIETLRRPGVEEAINALRGELAEIGRAVTEAMPRRAIETIEAEIQGLSARVAEGRQTGGDHEALAGIEHGLLEIRQALHTLTPAENLVGFNEAIDGLARKIDVIVAQKDPATLQQLESSIHTLRDISGHIASNEMVGRLATDVEALAEKVDRIANASAAGDALASLESRIGALSDALAERSQNGDFVPPRLEALVSSLSDKIEKIQMSRDGNFALGHLEDRIVQLVERLDASDSRLGHLEVIERGLADMLLHIEDMRGQKAGGMPHGDAPQGSSDLKDDLARTKVSLDAVHGTLGHVVDRLSAIEQEIRRAPQERGAPPAQDAAPLNIPVGKVAARAVPEAAPARAAAPQQQAPVQQAPAPTARQPQAQPPAQPQAQPVAKRPPMPQGKRQPINPDLPPDEPLEPGTRQPSSTPAERIAASEADLGNAKPKADEPKGGKSFFLAAARRAAKAAMRDSSPRVTKEAEPVEFDDEIAPPIRQSFGTRLKKVFIAASVIAIVIGLVQIASNYYDLGRRDIPSSVPVPPTDSGKSGQRITPDSPIAPAASDPSKQSSLPQSGMLPSTALSSVPELMGRSFNGAAPEITGSITKQATSPSNAVTPSINEKLPIAIGGSTLRNAALAGDAAAAYEVAIRFFDGRGVPANAADAGRWFERAAAKGLAPAQFRYASLLEKGQGVKKNLAAARKLYLASAEQGNAKAMHNLAVLYAEGIDGRPDYAAAVQWFRKASDHGISDSQYNLGVLYARGLGVEKNLGESYKWFSLAAAQGDHEAAKKRDEVAAQLEPKALAQLQKVVKNWAPQRQPEAATNVPVPAGGWDQAAPEQPPAKARSKASGSFEVGKR